MLAALCTVVGDVGPKFDTYMPVRGVLEVSFCSFLDQLSREIDGSHHRQDLLKLYQVVYPILAGGASASTSFVRTRRGAVQHSPMRSDSPAREENP